MWFFDGFLIKLSNLVIQLFGLAVVLNGVMKSPLVFDIPEKWKLLIFPYNLTLTTSIFAVEIQVAFYSKVIVHECWIVWIWDIWVSCFHGIIGNPGSTIACSIYYMTTSFPFSILWSTGDSSPSSSIILWNTSGSWSTIPITLPKASSPTSWLCLTRAWCCSKNLEILSGYFICCYFCGGLYNVFILL